MSEPADNTQPIPSAEGQDKGPSKNALKKAAKEAEKAKKAAERAAKEAEQAAARSAAEVDYSEQNYGKLPLNQSQERTGRPRTQISALNVSNDGEEVIIRARVHTSRAQGSKMVFFALRQRQHTVQALAVVAPETVSKQMVKWAAAVPLESIVLVEGTVKKSPEEIKGATIKDAEVHIKKFHLISEPEVRLPFNLEDVDKALEDERDIPTVSFDTRLNNRVLDLRTQTSQSIFILQSAVTDLFRESLQSKGFIEIHSPKLQGAATESGASVFKVDYFKGSAFLAQSPQLAKQMAIGADFERVYEIGPVFRAENSFTHRHLTEFTGLDLEMTIEEHYHEVMDTLDSMLLHIFNGLKTNADIEAIRRVYPSTEFTWLEKTLRLQWKDAIALLRENGVEIGDFDDINTETEKLLGRLVKDKYNTDYYILDKFPLVLRPFYTMPDPVDNRYSNSYDFFMRGEEILSGAQRVHDAKMLEQRMREVDINPADMQGYLDGFRMGIAPHGGGGIGLERVVMLFLKLGNIRNASLFPRDPKRLEPKNKNAIDHQSSHTLSAFLAIPIDVFKEIASLLTPEDILSLSRTNKFLRVLLMQRSSAPIWRTAGRNVEMLPSCPRHLSEPQYAALVFSKECSICGVIVMRQMDEHLSVRLCNTCRSENVIGVSQVPPVLVPYIPLSPYIKNTSRTNSTYALRADVERIESQLFKLPEDHEHHSYKRWDAKRRKRIRERTRHAMALLRYNNWTEVRKDDAMENVKYERIRDVQSRLLALGWKGEHMIMIESDAEKAWSRLICVSKPLTDRVWQRLCPKLLRLLKANRHHTHMMRKTRRQAERYECLEELLLDMRKGSCARLELAEADWPSASQQPEMFMPHPVLKEVLDYHVFKELLETDRSIEATRVKFHSSKELVNKAVLRWRAKLEDQLIDMLGNARAAQKREIPTTDELIEEALPFSTQLSEPSYDYVTPRNNGLFRADSVFTLGPQCGAMFYPNGFTTLVDIFCTLNQQLAETASTTFNASNLISSAVSHHTEGAAIAVALLKELGRPDAAYIEMEALGRMFLCGRCPYRQPQTWSSLIDHYVRERAKFLAYSSCNCHQRPDIAFNDIHDWRSASSWPLVRLLRDEEELNALNVRIPTVLEDLVECELCRELNLEVTFGSRRYIALHLRYVILQPEFGKHFTGMTTWFGGGLIEGGSGTVAGDGSAASSSGSQE